MRKISILILFTLAFAVTVRGQSLFCQVDPRDVRVELSLGQEKIKLTILSPMGYSSLAFLDMPVSQKSLDQLIYQADQMSPLGNQFWVQWKAESCRKKVDLSSKKIILECDSAESSSSKNIEFLSFAVATLSEETLSGVWKSFRFRMGVAVEGKWGTDYFFISIPMREQGCYFPPTDARKLK
jgi:hypothetical protein